MKKFFVILFLIGIHLCVCANNLIISNVGFGEQNTTSNYTYIKFDISWDNSWRVSGGSNNWDAVWVFVKYRKKSELTWRHATLNWVDGTGTNDGHIPSAGMQISSSNDNANNGSYGVFLYSSIDKQLSSASYTNVQLRWNYGVDGLTDNDSIQITLYGIEMVYVPQGSFYVGSGGSENGAFYMYPTTTNPYEITGEGAINVGTTSSYLYYANPEYCGDRSGPIPAAFPKGYSAFYCMKYEMTQEQYLLFLNSLTRAQQNARTATNLAAGVTAVTNRYVMTNTTTRQYRNGIRCDATIHTSNPITFYLDFNGNGVANESGDGQNIAMNYISWADIAAYLDWAALRPMTEFEFEKTCRGNQDVIANEYAWGNTTVNGATGISNSGANNETPSNAGAIVVYNNNGSVQGPIRVGSFGIGTNTREATGAGYYGIYGLSGNVWERPVTVGNATGRAFTGIHGNGVLDSNGDADVSNWPPNTGVGMGIRGGSWHGSNVYLCISNRSFSANNIADRTERISGRGVRLAP